jgi:hypothetical protein
VDYQDGTLIVARSSRKLSMQAVTQPMTRRLIAVNGTRNLTPGRRGRVLASVATLMVAWPVVVCGRLLAASGPDHAQSS